MPTDWCLLTMYQPHQPKLSGLPFVPIPKSVSNLDWHMGMIWTAESRGVGVPARLGLPTSRIYTPCTSPSSRLPSSYFPGLGMGVLWAIIDLGYLLVDMVHYYCPTGWLLPVPDSWLEQVERDVTPRFSCSCRSLSSITDTINPSDGGATNRLR